MKILTSNNVVVGIGTSITYGVYDEPFEKWKIENENGFYYMLNNNFTLHNVKATEEIKEYKYCFTEEKGFYLNENYRALIDPEEEIRILIQENIDLKAQLDKVQEVLDYLVMQ